MYKAKRTRGLCFLRRLYMHDAGCLYRSAGWAPVLMLTTYTAFVCQSSQTTYCRCARRYLSPRLLLAKFCVLTARVHLLALEDAGNIQHLALNIRNTTTSSRLPRTPRRVPRPPAPPARAPSSIPEGFVRCPCSVYVRNVLTQWGGQDRLDRWFAYVRHQITSIRGARTARDDSWSLTRSRL